MNADRLINMVVNRIVRVVVNRGVDMGIKGASDLTTKARSPKNAQQDVYIDDHGNTVQQRDPSRRAK